MKRVAVAPFELKLGPNESYGRAASVGTRPGAEKAQFRAKIILSGAAISGTAMVFLVLPVRRIAEFFFSLDAA